MIKDSKRPQTVTVQRVKYSLEERFWSKIIFGELSQCWEWNSFKRAGYGMYKIYSKGTQININAHRYMLQHTLSCFNEKLDTLHKCDNPGCVNPNHLFQGIHADNMRDMKDKKRARTKYSKPKIIQS